MEIDDKIGNLISQKKQIKLEISELKESLISREQLLFKINGAIEFAESLKEEKVKDKKEKKNA